MVHSLDGMQTTEKTCKQANVGRLVDETQIRTNTHIQNMHKTMEKT